MPELILLARCGELCLAKAGHGYYVFLRDDENDVVKAVYTGDRIGGQFKSAKGFTSDAVKKVAKGRKIETARSYYNEIRRARARARQIEQGAL